MTELERDLNLQLGDALSKIKLLEGVVEKANDIVKFVSVGKQGEAFQHIQFFDAEKEKLRQWGYKQVDLGGRC
jgi:hypothetical protein